MNLGLIDVEGGCFIIYIPWLGRGNGQSSPRTEVRGLLCRKWGKREGGYEILAACRSFSLVSSTFMRERRMVMIASNANGRIRYMIFSIAMQESG